MKTKPTENQIMLLRLAYNGKGKSVPVKGICLSGNIGGRGITAVIRGLEKRGLVKTSWRNVGVYRSVWSNCITITDDGIAAYEQLRKETSE